MKGLNLFLNAALALFAITAPAVGVFFVMQPEPAPPEDMREPIVVLATETITPVVQIGGKLVVKFTVHKTRECSTQIDRVLILLPEGRIVYRATVPGGGAVLGPSSPEYAVQLPDDLERGRRYIYRALIRSDCGTGDRQKYIARTPDAEFRTAE